MFFDELVAADKRINRIRALPLHRRGALLDAFRHDRDSTAPYAVDTDFEPSDGGSRYFSKKPMNIPWFVT